jgi:hypothetical protein
VVEPVVEVTPVVVQAEEEEEVVVIPEGRGVEAELERLETLAARLSVTAHKPGQAKNYTAAVSQMSILSKRLREEAEKRRDLLPRAEVEAAIHEFHGPIEREVRLLLRGLAGLLGLPVTPAVESARNKLVDETFARMGEEVFQ